MWLGLLVLAGATLFAAPTSVLVAPDTLRIPIVKPHPPSDPPDAALFSHWEHGDYGCQTCHPSLFPERRVGFTHEDMEAGRYCGSCHDGRESWSPKDRGVDCERCHVPADDGQDDLDEDLW